MPISFGLAVPVFVTIWFVTLFAIMPIGVHSQRETGEYIEGTDPGAPSNPQLLKKALWTTLVSLVLFGILLAVLHFYGWND